MQPQQPHQPKHRQKEFLLLGREVKLLALLIIALFATGTIGYSIIHRQSLKDGFYNTLETFAFEHQEESTSIGKFFQLFLLAFGVIILWFAIWTSLDLTLEGKFQDYFEGVKMMKKVKRLKNHYIICGGGRVGSHIADMLKHQKKNYVIIDKDEFVVTSLSKKGYLSIEGDVTEEKTLLDAGLHHAKALISVLPETEKNILVVLTARELRPDIKIYSRADREDLVKKLQNAGADLIVLPEVVCAREIVNEIHKDSSAARKVIG